MNLAAGCLDLVEGVGGWLGELVLPRVCPRCGRGARPGGVLCLGCRDEALEARSDPKPPPGLELVACGPEAVPPVRALVHGLKYSGHREAAGELVEIASRQILAEICPPGAVLVPVPLHPTRERERGYNQSELLAREWASRWGIPVGRKWLSRTRSTGTQTRLGSGDRRRNLEGAITAGPDHRAGVPVVLVDDVLTTGATLSACAAALLAAGTPRVGAVCVAWAGEA